MNTDTKNRMYNALLNAAELIRGHGETGLNPVDVDEESEKGLKEYIKACERSAKLIETLAKKYKK